MVNRENPSCRVAQFNMSMVVTDNLLHHVDQSYFEHGHMQKNNFTVSCNLLLSMFKFKMKNRHENMRKCRHVKNSNLNLPCTSRKKAT